MQESGKDQTEIGCEPDASVLESDQKEKPYYYDDAHGYETYDPESDDEEEFDD